MGRRINIRGQYWTVEVRKLAPRKTDGVWMATRGLCDFEKRVITLNPQFNLKAALLHEVAHACQPDLEENAVEEIENAYLDAIRALEHILTH